MKLNLCNFVLWEAPETTFKLQMIASPETGEISYPQIPDPQKLR